MLVRFQELSWFKKIAWVVMAVHVALVMTCVVHHFATRRVRSNKPIAVRMVAPVQQVVAAAPKIAQAKPAPVATKAAPLPAKKAAAPAKKGVEVVAKSKPVPKKEVAVVAKAPLAVPVLAAPNVKPLYITEEVKTEDITYGAFLIGYLQSTLDLPERGDVKVKLEIDRFGRLIDCEVLQARSEKNAEFLKNRLPELTFPCLNDYDILETSQTFTITFCNVEDL